MWANRRLGPPLVLRHRVGEQMPGPFGPWVRTGSGDGRRPWLRPGPWARLVPALPVVGAGEDGEPGHRVGDVVEQVARGGRVDRGRRRRALPAVGVVRDQLAGAVPGGDAVLGEVERAQLPVDAPALPGAGIGVV